MQGSLDSPPIVVRQDRFFACWFLLIPALLIFGFAGAALRRSWVDISISDYALLLAAVLLMLAMLLSMIFPATLTIGRDGFVWRTFLRTSHFGWVDFVEFDVISRPWFAPLLPREWAAGRFSRRSRKYLLSRRFSGDVVWFLPKWELSGPELADLLNAAQARWESPPQYASRRSPHGMIDPL